MESILELLSFLRVALGLEPCLKITQTLWVMDRRSTANFHIDLAIWIADWRQYVMVVPRVLVFVDEAGHISEPLLICQTDLNEQDGAPNWL